MKLSSIPKSGRKGSVVYLNIWIRTCLGRAAKSGAKMAV